MEPDKMKFVAAMLVCPHQWGEQKKVTLVDKGERKDGDYATCSLCGTHRVVYPDGTASIHSPDAISTTPPTGT